MTGSRSRKQRWRWWVGAVIAPALYAASFTLLMAGLQSVSVEGGLAGLERQALGWMLLHRPSRPADPRIVMVALDTPLYEEREAGVLAPETPPGRPLASYRKDDCDCEPIPRECYARAVERLHRWGAGAVVLDIMFRTKSRSATDRAEDERLGNALFQANNVAAAAVMKSLALDRSRDPTITSDVLLDPPVAAVTDNAYVGSPKVDPRDAEYSIELLQTAHDSSGGLRDYPSLPYLAFCLATEHPQEDLSRWKGRWLEGPVPRLMGDIFTRHAQEVPAPAAGASPSDPPSSEAARGGVALITSGNVVVDEAFYQKRLVINYAPGSDAAVGRYRPVRLSWLLSCSEEEGRARFRDRIVLIGNPAEDLHRTVVGALPGTEVLANAVQTLLEDRPIVPVRNEYVLLLMFLSAWITALAIRQFSALAAALVVGLQGIQILLLTYVLVQHDYWLMPITPLFTVFLSAGAAFIAESKAGQGMVARLIPSPISSRFERMGGSWVEEGTVMFSDIRGYSTFSEYLEPAEMMARLNAYFTTVHEILHRYGGHFMKSPGDCVVAWFAEERYGAPHSERAMRAAIEMIMNAVQFREQWTDDEAQRFDIGVGINTGPLAVGMLDAHRHIEPTVIGDAVNVASRLESLTKEYGAAMIVSEEALAPVRERFLSEALGEVGIKGRSQTVRIHRIIGIAPEAAVIEDAPWWRRRQGRSSPRSLFFRIGSGDGAAVESAENPLDSDLGVNSRENTEAAPKEEALVGSGESR